MVQKGTTVCENPYIEKILNRPITKFYDGDDVNVIVTELWLTKTANFF